MNTLRPNVAFVALVSLSACAFGPVPQISTERPKLTDGAWVLSGAWQGYMGVALQFRSDGTFRYWDSSDVGLEGPQPRQPFAGHWRWSGSVLELTSKQDLHANRWHVFAYHGQLALLPDYAREWQLKDHKLHEDRLLFHIAQFDQKHPQLNYGGFEHPEGNSPISP